MLMEYGSLQFEHRPFRASPGIDINICIVPLVLVEIFKESSYRDTGT